MTWCDTWLGEFRLRSFKMLKTPRLQNFIRTLDISRLNSYCSCFVNHLVIPFPSHPFTHPQRAKEGATREVEFKSGQVTTHLELGPLGPCVAQVQIGDNELLVGYVRFIGTWAMQLDSAIILQHSQHSKQIRTISHTCIFWEVRRHSGN